MVPQKIMDGVQDCDDNSDECPPDVLANNPLSSREHLIASPILRVLVWIMATISILGNFLVIVENVVTSKRRDESPIGKCNRILLINLAVADFLMGIVLLMIGIKSALTSGKYCEYDKPWRTSVHCSIIGILAVLSSETSVLCLVALTCYRLYGVLRPIDALYMRPKRAVWLVIILWIVALTLAIIPMIPTINQTMVTSALIAPSKYFDNTVVTWDSYHTFAGRLRALVPRNNEEGQYDISSWVRAVEATNMHYPNVSPDLTGYFGYYSTDGVCIPRLFRLEGTGPLHPLTLVVVSVNFTCLAFIIVSYAMIYWISTRNVLNSANSTSTRNRGSTMQRKISALIITDLCCWLPICVMAFLTQRQTYVSGTTYAIAAIILLPINSSLNPMIYSGGFYQLRNVIMRTMRRA